MALQMPISFKDLAVRFSEEEWRLLEEGQREFYRDVMRENYETLVSVGTAELLPLSAFLSPVEAGRATGPGGCAGEGQGAPAGGGPQGQPQHSLHLTALVQLVKEIPEFLFGEVKGTEDSPKSGEASLDGEGACPEAAAVAVETRPLQGLLNCLPDSPMSRPSLSSTPASSSSSSGLRGDGGQRSPLLIKTADRPWPAEKESPGASGTEPGTPTYSPSQRKSHQRPERGTMGTGVSPGSSPLQGLINCLKEILVPGPQHPDAAPSSLPPPPSLGVARQTSRELQLGRPPWPVKTEAASGDCPLQGLLNCLKEIPEAQDRRPTSSGAGHARVQEDPQPWQRNSGGSGPLQTLLQLAGPGAGSVLTMVKVEDSWAPSPPMPTSCQLSRPGHSPSATRDPRGVHVPSWDPEAQVCRASSSPLEALEACLKGIPSSTLSPPQPLATSWSRSPQPGDAGYQRPGLRPQGPHGEEASREPLPPLGLQSCVRDGQGPVGLPGSQSTPTGFSSASSTDGDLDFGSPCRSQGQRPRKGYPPGNSPLQGLENCLREIPLPRLQPARVCPSAADRGPWRVEPRSWVAHKEGLRGEAWESAHRGQGGREVPSQSPHLASPQAFAPSCIPACLQREPKDQGPAKPGPWSCLQDGAAATPSPLHCLESSLREILPVRPLHFACLASPGPSLGPSPGSSSSLSSSDGEDPRLEPELWQLAPQERDHLASHKRPGPGESPGGSGSSPREDSERTEPQDCSRLRAGNAEEGPRGRFQSRKEAGTERSCQPGPPSCAGAGGGREAAGPPWPSPQLEKRSGPAPGDRPRGLEAECRRPSIAAKTQARLLPQDPLEPLSKSPIPAAVSPAQPATTPLPPCACGRSLQQELHNLGATLAEKLDQLAVALAGLAQEVATMRTQVDQLGRSPQRPGSKGQTSWPWSCPRRPRWVISPGHRHPPYWRQKGPTRPRPKILRAQVEGCRAGDPPGLSRRRVPPVPQLPADASLTEPSRPNHSSCQQPPSAPVCSTVPTEHSLLGHTGRHQSPLSHSLPAALPPQRVSPDTDLSAAGAAPVSAPALPKDPSSLLGAAFREDLWGSEHRDPRWGTH